MLSSSYIRAHLLALSVLISACTPALHGSTLHGPAQPEPASQTPAKVIEPFLPPGAPVDAATAMSLTLAQVLVFADTHAPKILTTRARAGLTEADVIDAKTTLRTNPELSFGVGGRTVDGATGLGFEVGVEQQFEVAGEPALRTTAALDRRRAAKATVNEVRWLVHVEAHRIFIDLLVLRERLEQAKRFVAFSQSMRDITARQVEAGGSSPLVLLVAETDLAQTREAIIEIRQLNASLSTRLAATIGWPMPTLPPIDGALPKVRAVPDTKTLLALMAKHHPTLRTRELAIRAQRSRLAFEERSAWPTPTLGFSYAREPAPGAEPEANIWMFNVALPLPIWRTNQGGQARAQAEIHLAGRERDETALRLRSDLLRAAIALNAAAEQVALYETGIMPQLEQNLALLQRAYEVGEVDVHQVSQTRERLLSATDRYIDARITYYDMVTTLGGLVGTELWLDLESTP